MNRGVVFLAGMVIGALLAGYVTAGAVVKMINRLPLRKRVWIAWRVLCGKLELKGV